MAGVIVWVAMPILGNSKDGVYSKHLVARMQLVDYQRSFHFG